MAKAGGGGGAGGGRRCAAVCSLALLGISSSRPPQICVGAFSVVGKRASARSHSNPLPSTSALCSAGGTNAGADGGAIFLDTGKARSRLRRPGFAVGVPSSSTTRLGASAPTAAQDAAGSARSGEKSRTDRRRKATGRRVAAAASPSDRRNGQKKQDANNSSREAPAKKKRRKGSRRGPGRNHNRRRGGRRGDDSAWYQRSEMLNHEILTLEEDLEMGRRIRRATELRAALRSLADDRREERRQRVADLYELGDIGDYDDDDGRAVNEDGAGVVDSEGGSGAQWTLGGDDADALLSDGGLFGMGMGIDMGMTVNNNGNGDVDVDGDDISESAGFSILERETAAAARAARAYIMVDEGSRFASDPIERDLGTVSDDDIEQILEVPGGRAGLRHILNQGAEARDTLMRCNVRLVVSISKRWMKNSAASFSPNDAGGRSLIRLYAGGWDRPSLDEVIQEGVVGLARAVDKYDPSRGLRFSTYSTHWITNYVRLTFQTAKTGCLKVPYQLHDIKKRYRRLVREYYDEGATIPDGEALAKILGVTPNRLETALRVTEGLLSLDQPINQGGGAKSKGSGAGMGGGGAPSGEGEILISDTLQCREPRPEEHVELSFLRQCLENAMAAELSPHERDVLRLRLGLDDGQSRTVREVVEVCGGGIRAADVRSAERRAFKKLSSPSSLHAYNLRDYLHMAGLEYDPLHPRR